MFRYIAICSPNYCGIGEGAGLIGIELTAAGVTLVAGAAFAVATVFAVASAAEFATELVAAFGASVAVGIGVKIVVKLFSLLAEPDDSALFCSVSGATELVMPALVGSGTGRKAKNKPPATSAKIIALVTIMPALGFLPTSRAIAKYRKANAVPL